MKAPIVGRFDLVDHHGLRVTERSYHGRWLAIFFGFTHCQVVCPRALAKISAAIDGLGDIARDVQPLYITVDPDRDTPAVMSKYLMKYPRFIGLTGTQAQVAEVHRNFVVFSRRLPGPSDGTGYAVAHTAITYLLDPSAGYQTHWTDSAPAEQITAALRDQLMGSHQ